MKKLLLLRLYEANGATWGHLIGKNISVATMERTWKQNEVNVSCIRSGPYDVIPDATGKHKYYAVQNVRGRTAIEFHPANYPSELQGCIALGDSYNINGTLTHSRDAMDNFIDVMGHEPFELIIENLEDL